MGWMSEAKRATDYIVEPATVVDEENKRIYPCVAFAFRHDTDDEELKVEPIYVTFVATPHNMIRFRKDIGRAIDEAMKRAASQLREL